MYPTKGQLLLGFHGCDQAVKEKILLNRTRMKPSKNRWDWLGHGIYFWEADPKRALYFARIVKTRPNSKVRKPSAIGAVIDLGNCLNLLNSGDISVLRESYLGFKRVMEVNNEPMPINRSLPGKTDILLRDLDCAVINYLHEAMVARGEPPFDSVRAAFWEGKEIYPGAGFKELNHIQICIRNPNCIKGYFDPLKPIPGWPQV